MKKIFTCILLLAGIYLPGNAQLLNPHIEQGVPGWDSIGTAMGIRCLGDTVASPYYSTGYAGSQSILPQWGYHFMELYSGGTTNITALESFANVPPSTIDTLNPDYSLFPGSPSVSTFGSAIRQIVPVYAGQVLEFDYLYGTNEAPQYWGCDHNSEFIDYSYFTIASDDTILVFILSSTADMIGTCPLYNLQYGCDLTYTNSNDYCTTGSTSFFTCPIWQTFIFPFTQNDTVIISFGVVNVGDNTGTSKLFLDNFSLNIAPVLTDANINCISNQSTTIGFTNINSQVSDLDEDTICNFIINSLPANGILVLNIGGGPDTLTIGDIGTQVSSIYLDSLVYIPNTNFTGLDSFDLQVSDCNGGNSNVATIYLNTGFVGIEEGADLPIFPYPNPTTGIIQFNLPADIHEVKAEVLDTKGKLIMVKYSTSQLDLSGLANGLYILRLSAGNMQKITKVLKQD